MTAASSSRDRHWTGRRRLAVVTVVLAALFGLAGVAAACDDSAGGATASPQANAVRATVNGRAVSDDAVAAVRAALRLESRKDTASVALREAIARELVRQEAERLGVELDKDVVARRLQSLEEQYGGESGLDEALANVKVTRAQLEASLDDSVLREALQDAKFPKLVADRDELLTYYHRHLKDAFTRGASVKLGAIQVASELIGENALKRLRAGRPFEEVARQFSTDMQSKAEGGQLGWVLAGSLPSALRKALRSAGSDGLAGPVRGPGGWFVLKVYAERPKTVLAFDDVREYLRRDLTRKKREAALKTWLKDRRAESDISIP